MTDPARRTLLVTDLDNTLWDWFDVWHRSFSAFLEAVSDLTDIPISVLEREAYEVHQRRHTSEYSYLINELPSVIAAAGEELPSVVFDEASHRQNSARVDAMKLYPGVRESLLRLKQQGVMIAAYTESVSFWTEWRLSKTGLDGLIDVLYSAPDHDLPEGVSFDDIRYRTKPQLTSTEHRPVPRGALKPNAAILTSIIADCGRAPSNVVYVGDSLMKDVAMAQEVGALDVWAQYGVATERPEYELLRRVTHWSAQDVERERELAARPTVAPTVTLDEGFPQILALF